MSYARINSTIHLVIRRLDPMLWLDSFPVGFECRAQRGGSGGVDGKHSPRKDLICVSLAAMLLSAATGYAGDSASDIKQRIGAGDPVAGKVKSLICQACHGKDGNPATADCPKLAGQYAVYIQKQIEDFKIGSRKDPIMTDIAIGLTNKQDLLDIAAYFASQKQMKGAKPVVTVTGHNRFTSGNGCQTCHGLNGKGLAPDNPRAPVIGGQHKEYLVKQLKDFRSNARTNEGTGIMGMIAAMMSDEEIDDVAGYESGL